MNEELKPCPFCGGRAALAFEDVDYVGHMHAVQCNKCGVITEYYENSTMAIEHWNRRAEVSARRTRMSDQTQLPHGRLRREYLFRGRLQKNEWAFGSLIISANGQTQIREYDGLRHIDIDTLVDPPTVGQYTGETDNEGLMIFEHDIVSFSLYQETDDGSAKKEIRGIVIKKHSCYAIESKKLGMPRPLFAICGNYISIRVIGNIFDTPELIKDCS